MDGVNLKKSITENRQIKEETPFENYLQQFCASTSIHGLKFLGEPNRYIVEKIWWLAVLILASAGSSSLIYQSYVKWTTSPIVVTLATSETPIWKVPFPAVTICPEFKTNANIFNYTNVHLKYLENETVTKEEDENFQLLSLICESEIKDKGIDYFGRVQIEKMIKMLSYSDVESCKWAGKELNCTAILEPIITLEGLCETFNMLDLSEIVKSHVKNMFTKSRYNNIKARQWTLSKGYEIKARLDAYPRRTILSGVKSGFQIDLYVNDKDLDYTCREIQGFKVSLHHPGEIPDLVNYFRVPLDQVVVAAVKPNMITTSDNLVNYDPYIRQCYLPEEIKLTSFNMYTQRNCILECLSNYLISKCGCTMMYLPHENSTKFCGPGKAECVGYYEALLMEKGGNQQNNPDGKLTKFLCGCLPLCTSLSFDAETSQTDWNWRRTYNLLKKKSTLVNFDYESGHYSRLIVFYKEMQFMSSERHEVYGFMEFWGTCGGLFGLFLGFSFTSSMEILYFLTLRLICNVKKFGRIFSSGIPPIDKQNVTKLKY